MDLFLQALRVVVMQVGKPLHLSLVVFFHAVNFSAMAVRQFNDRGFQIGDFVRADLLQVCNAGFLQGVRLVFGRIFWGGECATGSGRGEGLGMSRFSVVSYSSTSDGVMLARPLSVKS